MLIGSRLTRPPASILGGSGYLDGPCSRNRVLETSLAAATNGAGLTDIDTRELSSPLGKVIMDSFVAAYTNRSNPELPFWLFPLRLGDTGAQDEQRVKAGDPCQGSTSQDQGFAVGQITCHGLPSARRLPPSDTACRPAFWQSGNTTNHELAVWPTATSRAHANCVRVRAFNTTDRRWHTAELSRSALCVKPEIRVRAHHLEAKGTLRHATAKELIQS